MPRAVVLALLLPVVSFAAEPAPPPAPLPDVPVATTLGYAGASVGLLALSAVVGTFAGAALPQARFEALGRHDALSWAGGLALGFGVNFALTHTLLPEFTLLGDTDQARGSSEAARDEAWRVGRWALGAVGVGVGTFAVGALLERHEFGSGQGAILAGGLLFLAAALTWDVLEAVFAWSGYTHSRKAVTP